MGESTVKQKADWPKKKLLRITYQKKKLSSRKKHSISRLLKRKNQNGKAKKEGVWK